MVAPRAIAKFNRRVTNPILSRVAVRAPGFAMIHHTGRKSGKTYRTPVNMFPHEGGYMIALTYGPGSDWVRNVLAAGGCDAVVRGKTIHLVDPRVVHDPQRHGVPAMTRPFLRVVGVNDFLHVRPEADAPAG